MADKTQVRDKAEGKADGKDGQQTGLDSTQYQVGERGIKAPVVKQPAELADQWNAVNNGPGGPERFNRINQDMMAAFKNAYDKAPGSEAEKAKAVKDLEAKINETTIDGRQVLAQVKDGKISVRNVEAVNSGEVHPDMPKVHIRDIGASATADLRKDASDSRLERPGAGSDGKVDTKQFPSDALFYKAMHSNPEWATAPWKATNPGQEALLKGLKDPKTGALADSIPADMLDAKSGSTKEVNDFLQQKGFGRLLQERPHEEAVAATFNIKRDWHADKSAVNVDGKQFSAIDKGSKLYNVDGKPVVELYKGPDGVSVYAIPNDRSKTGFEAMQDAKRLIPQVDGKPPAQEGNTRIPMVDFSAQESLGWLTGMQGGDRTVSQAVMQTTLKMDENGFDAKQALAMGATRGIHIAPEPIYTFNSDFTFVVAKNGQPVFAQPVTKESWKDPKRQ